MTGEWSELRSSDRLRDGRSVERKFVQDEAGATSIEYSLIAALMAIAVIACLTAFEPQMLAAFNQMGADMATPPNVTAE